MKNRIKSIMWLLLLGIGTTTLVQSCQKEPCEPCTETVCDMKGYISYEPQGCFTPPTGKIGILGDDGTFYLINKDHTGNFNDFEVGDYVTFGMCTLKEVSTGNKGTPTIWAPPVKEGDLGCIRGEEKPEEPGDCKQEAEIVGVRYQLNGPIMDAPYLKIDGDVFAARGKLAEELQKYPLGTKLLVDAVQTNDCFLPTVITYPEVIGCVELTCLTPLVSITQ